MQPVLHQIIVTSVSLSFFFRALWRGVRLLPLPFSRSPLCPFFLFMLYAISPRATPIRVYPPPPPPNSHGLSLSRIGWRHLPTKLLLNKEGSLFHGLRYPSSPPPSVFGIDPIPFKTLIPFSSDSIHFFSRPGGRRILPIPHHSLKGPSPPTDLPPFTHLGVSFDNVSLSPTFNSRLFQTTLRTVHVFPQIPFPWNGLLWSGLSDFFCSRARLFTLLRRTVLSNFLHGNATPYRATPAPHPVAHPLFQSRSPRLISSSHLLITHNDFRWLPTESSFDALVSRQFPGGT